MEELLKLTGNSMCPPGKFNHGVLVVATGHKDSSWITEFLKSNRAGLVVSASEDKPTKHYNDLIHQEWQK